MSSIIDLSQLVDSNWRIYIAAGGGCEVWHHEARDVGTRDVTRHRAASRGAWRGHVLRRGADNTTACRRQYSRNTTVTRDQGYLSLVVCEADLEVLLLFAHSFVRQWPCWKWMMLGRVKWWLDDQMTGWLHERWQDNQMIGWTDERMTRWQDDQMTGSFADNWPYGIF